MGEIMLIKHVFQKVDYPRDRKSIEHIIKEYDKNLNHLLVVKESNKLGKYVLYIMSILIIFYVFNCSWVSIFVRLLYIIPCALIIICNSILILQIKKHKENKKLQYKYKVFELIFISMFIYIGTFFIESILFSRKWGDENYLEWFYVLVILCIVTFLMARVNAPKKFIKKFQYQENKLYTPSSILTSITSLLICISYYNKPYYLVLIVSYIILILMSGLVTYIFFVYRQYDNIQKLKNADYKF
ncbi:hypothetical protein [Clostridium sp. YIM B02555]|uniref:hypothetical protein n=1 Tax=Clostridium sp. YIM B02555 TaxID=2911968 RepID=UPI001EEF1D7A|nr:hypothetical protein [Clostridium sp. YIM B02555]